MSKKENFTPPEEEAADAEIPLSLTCNRQEWVPALVNGNIDSLNFFIINYFRKKILIIFEVKTFLVWKSRIIFRKQSRNTILTIT